jgi:hypothetical protein
MKKTVEKHFALKQLLNCTPLIDGALREQTTSMLSHANDDETNNKQNPLL